ncbi:MAG: T9SS type A sorting domain-containing protein, partial [Candidatus Eisenbacteria bacterium]|nr:T9SS type A sorting domain-containing protein [Candidatus Eisenbacteria bacterium]
DISDPSGPSIVGSYNTPGYAQSVAVAGDLVFAADDTSGLRVVDISDPTNPSLVASYNTPDESFGVAVAGDYAFVGDTFSLQVIAVLQSQVDMDRNIGQSLAVDGGNDAILRARLTSTETAGVSWELSADAGANWQAVTADGSWSALVPGDDLLWRTTHAWTGSAANPTVSNLTLDWLNEHGPIASITDLPDDQGGWVRLSFTRSGYDFADEAELPVAGYQVYRRVDDPSRIEQILNEGSVLPPSELEDPLLSSFRSSSLLTIDDQIYLQGGAMAQGEFPPGVWEIVANVFATQNDSYTVAVPTTADSTESEGTHWSVFMTTTHTTTPSIWFASEPDSGYSVDNIAPGVPQNLAFGGSNLLEWDAAPENDFQYHTVYGSDVDELDPSATLLGYTVDPSYDVSGSPFAYFHVTTSDHAGNESGAASVGNATSSAEPGQGRPGEFALQPVSPNPIHTSATLRFDLPETARVELGIFDVHGRRVRTLSSGDHAAGRHAVSWDGRDGTNVPVGSGVYFARLETGTSTAVQRLLVVR